MYHFMAANHGGFSSETSGASYRGRILFSSPKGHPETKLSTEWRKTFMSGKPKRSFTVLALIAFGVVQPVSVTLADDAAVLPVGIFDFAVEGLISLPITKRFNKDGDKEPLATDFNTNLNSSVFSDLSLVEGAFGLPPGSASFGTTDVKFTRHIQIYNFNFAYGLTDRLSIGMTVPYWHQTND